MLNLWRKAWRGSRRSPQPSGPNSTGLTIQPGAAPSGTALHPSPDAAVIDSFTTKRSRDEPNQPDDEVHSRPIKKIKTIDGLANDDSLATHLPEIINVSESSVNLLSPIPSPKEVLTHVLRNNTIVTVPNLKASIDILTAFLSHIIQSQEQGATIRHGTVVLVADDPATANTYIVKLGGTFPSLRLGRYMRDNRAAELPAWSKLIGNDIVGTSAQTLLEGFERGIISMQDLRYMIVIDAQYLKDQDSQTLLPLRQIMDRFYNTSENLHCPRLLITATLPFAQWSTYDSGMLRLEKIFTASIVGMTEERRAEIASLPDRPNEVVVMYEGVKSVFETKLYKQLHQLDPSQSTFGQQFKASKHLLWELGGCASDLIWRRALSDMKSNITPWDEGDDESDDPGGSIPQLKSRISHIVANWDFTMPNLDLNSRGFNVTHKFLRLVHVLKSCKAYGEAFRGIVFVRRRSTALIMVDLLRMLDEHLGFLRPCALTGRQILNDSHRPDILKSFAVGTFNLIVATKSAEDIELPRALIVIRFDLFDSEVSLAYMKSRTRGRESHIVHMVERNNDTHRRIAAQSASLDLEMLRWQETVVSNPCSAVPPRSLKETSDPYCSDSEDEDINELIQDPVTSGQISPKNATTVIYRYVTSAAGHTTGTPLFQFCENTGKGQGSVQFTCNVLLQTGPVAGTPARSMALARRSACYRACLGLVSSGMLDYRLFYLIRPSNLSPPSEEIKSSGYSGYIKKRPDFWDNAIPVVTLGPKMLYPMSITVAHTTDLAQLYAPLLFLTWKPLPDLPHTHLFFSGMPALTQFRRGQGFLFTDNQVQSLHKYTVRATRSILNKRYNCNISDMAYFIAPIMHKPNFPESSSKHSQHSLLDLADIIDWRGVQRAVESWAVPLTYDTQAGLFADSEDAVVQDRWVEFTRRYDILRVRPDLKPLSKPDDSSREATYNSLLHFCLQRRVGFEGLKDYEQSIIEVSKCSSCFNHLNPTTLALTPSSKVPAKYLIPELCAKFTIPASTFRTTLLLPCIASRIDDFLLVKELNTKLFDNATADNLLYMAICAPSAGMEHDYERLELLGDAFLKYLSSVYIFVTKPSDSEGSMHMIRQKIISNKTLFHAATQVGLPQYIQSKPLSIRMWHPPNFYITPPNPIKSSRLDPTAMTLSAAMPPDDNTVQKAETDEEKKGNTEGKGQGKRKAKKKRIIDPNTQWLGEKAIADVAEAIIGAAYVSGGRDAALKVAKALHVPIYDIDQWSDFGRKVLAPPPVITAELPPGTIGAVENIIGHRFEHAHLLAQALTHSSYSGMDSTTYERFEFIGDAILDFMVIRYIFDREDKLSPGGLTLLKGAMVSNAALAAVCVWSGLQEYLLFDSPHLANSIRAYSAQMRNKQAEEYATAEKEGRLPGQYWLEMEPPKALSDVVESIIGAVYVSDNFSPVGAEAIFDKLLRPFYSKHITLKSLSHHPTKSLFELFQAQGCQSFGILKEKEGTGPTRCSVVVHDIVLAIAEGGAPSTAARLASLFSLDALEGDPGFLGRTCDCRTRPRPKKTTKDLEALLASIEDDSTSEYPVNPEETVI